MTPESEQFSPETSAEREDRVSYYVEGVITADDSQPLPGGECGLIVQKMPGGETGVIPMTVENVMPHKRDDNTVEGFTLDGQNHYGPVHVDIGPGGLGEFEGQELLIVPTKQYLAEQRAKSEQAVAQSVVVWSRNAEQMEHQLAELAKKIEQTRQQHGR